MTKKVIENKMEGLDVKDVNFLKRVLKDIIDFNGDIIKLSVSTKEQEKKGISFLIAEEDNRKIMMSLMLDVVDEDKYEDIVYNCDVFEDGPSEEPTYKMVLILTYKPEFDRPFREFLFRDEEGNVITYVFRAYEINLNYYKEKYYSNEINKEEKGK